eukprot:3784_1
MAELPGRTRPDPLTDAEVSTFVECLKPGKDSSSIPLTKSPRDKFVAAINSKIQEYDDKKFPLFKDDPVKVPMGQWLVQSVIKKKFKLTPAAKEATDELSVGDEGMDKQTAETFVDIFWVIAQKSSDMDQFMVIYNLYQWYIDEEALKKQIAVVTRAKPYIIDEDALKHFADETAAMKQIADSRMQYIAFTFLPQDTDYGVNFGGDFRKQIGICLNKAKSECLLPPGVEPTTPLADLPDAVKTCIGEKFASLVRNNGNVRSRREKKTKFQNVMCGDVISEIHQDAKKEFIGSYDRKPLEPPYKAYVDPKLDELKPKVDALAETFGAHRGYDAALDVPLSNGAEITYGYGYNYLERDWMGGFLTGGLVGASVSIVLILVFCVGLALGLITYWGYSEKGIG